MPKLFFSYSHADEAFRDQLEKQLTMLKRQGIIETWHDRRINAGDELDASISAHVDNDDIILLLVSPDFLASSYCYDREMTRAMERHEQKDATVIPVILRPCEWQYSSFGKLLATPTDGRPINLWPDKDLAFLEVAKAIRRVAEGYSKSTPRPSVAAVPTTNTQTITMAHEGHVSTLAARSSNLRIAKQFSERERDQFKIETFQYIENFFENSLRELQQRNQGIEGSIRKIDANRFTASIYKNGKAASRCTIFMGGGFSRDSIAYSSSEQTSTNSYNESLSVEADDQTMYLKSGGMRFGSNANEKLSQEGAAELFWAMLIEPLQRNP